MTARATPPAEAIRRFRRRIGAWSVIKSSLPPLLALSALAITQPLLDLFGRNPEFFVASDMTKPEILMFAIAAALLVPLIGLALVLLAAAIGGERGARWATNVLVATLAFALGLTVARQLDLDRTLFAAAVGIVVTGLVTALRLRSAGFRQLLRYLALGPLAFLALFVFASESSALLRSGEPAAAAGVTVGHSAPVVFIVLDELPVASLMRADGTLNDERFPNFARLAEEGTWYRDATSVATNTSRSVPTILDGNRPGGMPTSLDHPDNLFTLLGDSYDVDATEPITDLCPGSVCAAEHQSIGDFVRRLRRSIADASVVYGHVSLPRRFRIDLPVVDQSWHGFLADAGPDAIGSLTPVPQAAGDTPADETPEEFVQRSFEEREAANLQDGPGRELHQVIAQSSVEDDDDMLFVHALLPHFPWVRTPTGAIYESRPRGQFSPYGTWDDSEFLITQALQRHLLQVGFADKLLGELIDKLQADDVWDDALVVVTADHGMSFEHGEPARRPTEVNEHEVYKVPLFIKAPAGEGGVVDDRTARTIDILPTIVDLLDIETAVGFDGTSLIGEARADDPPVVAGGVEGTIAVAARNADLLPHGDHWQAVAAPGPFGVLVGTAVEDLGARPGPDRGWSVDQGRQLESVDPGGIVPLILTGEIDAADNPGAALLIAVNGTVAGVVGFEERAGGGPFSAILDESAFIHGSNVVGLLAVRGSPPPGPMVVQSLGRPD